jgi:RNA polymerase sigma-54 factor
MQLQRPSFLQEQRLKMNPQLYQSLKLMELPVMSLREKIEEELERNPALEVLEDNSVVSLDEAQGNDEYEYDDYFDDDSEPQHSSEDSDAHRRFMEGVLNRPETLQEHLIWQLQLEPADAELRAIAVTLIQNLDDDGFHREPPETLFAAVEAPEPAAAGCQDSFSQRLNEALWLVRGLEPRGTCTANYRESLEVQIDFLKNKPKGIKKALDHLDLIEREKFGELARAINVGESEARNICRRIRELSPFPGRAFAAAEVRYVVPDAQIIRDEGEFAIVLNDETIPVLGINPFFEKLNALPDGVAARDFVKENIKEARLFIQQLNQRNLTLLRVTKAILEFQRRFFIDGPKYLAPLTQGDIARELGMNVATISRASSGKYLQTEWGIFEIRHFYSNSISGKSSRGSKYSKEGVKSIINEILASENKPLTDQDISDLLNRRGISLARRTVAKYRQELDKSSSYTR